MRIARQFVPGAQIVIHTNGTRLTRKLYRELVNVGVAGFLITRHAKKWPAPVLDIVRNEKDSRQFLRMHDFDGKVLFNRGGTTKPEFERKLNRCFYLSDEIAVTRKGEVVCTNDFHVTESFGNVNTQHLLNDVWWGERFTHIRRRLRHGHFDLNVCKLCSGKKVAATQPVPRPPAVRPMTP